MRWLFSACGVLSLAFAQAASDPLVGAAAAYVRDYQQQLTAVVADETYSQHVRAQVPRDRGMPSTRVLQSEIFFMFTPGYDWMAIRDVAEMDRRPVGDRRDIRKALMTLPAPQVARTFKQYNSRFNLGRIVRNFNEPTLSLLPLDDRHRGRFTFERRGTRRAGGSTLTRIGYRETAGPTLVRNLRGENVFASGEYAVDEAGRVLRAMMALQIGTVTMTLTTTYERDERLQMLVPVRFGEHYRDGTDAKAPRPLGPVAAPSVVRQAPQETAYFEEIVCEATYTNFRRFEVKAIIR